MERAKYDLSVAKLCLKIDVEVFARSGRKYMLSKLTPKGYKPTPVAIREVICAIYRAGVEMQEVSIRLSGHVTVRDTLET